MKFALLLSVALSVSMCPLAAQDTPWWEGYGGFQFTRTDTARVQDLADSLTVPNDLPRINVGRTLNMEGFNVSLQENSASWWGGVLDLSGSFKTKNIDLSQVAQSLGLVPAGTRVVATFHPAFYTFAFGPQFTYRKMSKIQPFARIMFGGAHSDLEPDKSPHVC
jgi:hypothetical protein